MLLYSGIRQDELPMGVESIHNYYEHLVLDRISQVSDRARSDMDFLSDVACVALNRLPPRYIRHNVDMTFFLSPLELDEIYQKVDIAVNEALLYVTSRDHPSTDTSSDSFEE